MVEGSMKCVKYLLFGFNLIFAISGIAILVVGALIEHLYSQYITFLDDKFLSTPVLLIVVGVIVFVVAFFGCCGAVKENHCMIITFGVLLALIFILELAAGIAAYVLKDDVRSIMEKNMYRTLGEFNATDKGALTQFWIEVQREKECCGVHNASDWQNNVHVNPGVKKDNVPDSCCQANSTHKYVTGCGRGQMHNSDRVWQDGCLPTMRKFIEDNVTYVGGVGVGIAFIQLLGIIFSCCLARSIKREYESV